MLNRDMTRRFGMGVTTLFAADDADEALVQRKRRRQRQRDYKEQLDAAEAYKANNNGGQAEHGIGGGAFQRRRRRQAVSGDLPPTSRKIGAGPAPYMNRRNKQWEPWDQKAFRLEQERQAVYANLGASFSAANVGGSGGAGYAVASLTGDRAPAGRRSPTGDDERGRNPITGELLPPTNVPRRGQHGGVGAPMASVNRYQRVGQGLTRRSDGGPLQYVHRLSAPFADARSPSQRPFNLEDLGRSPFAVKPQQSAISLPFSPLDRRKAQPRLHGQHGHHQQQQEKRAISVGGGGILGGIGHRSLDSLVSPMAARNSGNNNALVQMDKLRRRQFYQALLSEKARSGVNTLYETDVRRVCGLFFLPANAINTALRNAMSVMSSLGDNRVELETFMRRLFGDSWGRGDGGVAGGESDGMGAAGRFFSSPTTYANALPLGRRSASGPDTGMSDEADYAFHNYRGAHGQVAKVFPKHAAIREFTDSFPDGPPTVPPHLDIQRQLVLGRKRLERKRALRAGGPRISKAWFAPGEDLVKAPWAQQQQRLPRKTSGTQTSLDGDYGTSRSIMEEVVRQHMPFPKPTSGVDDLAMGGVSPSVLLRTSGLINSAAMEWPEGSHPLDWVDTSMDNEAIVHRAELRNVRRMKRAFNEEAEVYGWGYDDKTNKNKEAGLEKPSASTDDAPEEEAAPALEDNMKAGAAENS